MSGFNDNFLYVPKTPEELLQELTDFYNLQFNLSLTSQEFSNTLEDRAQEYNLQTALQNNVMLGSLYDELVQYLKKQQLLSVEPKGCSVVGIDNIITSLSFINGYNIANYNPNTYTDEINPGECCLVFDYESTPANDAEIVNQMGFNSPSGINYGNYVGGVLNSAFSFQGTYQNSDKGTGVFICWRQPTSINLYVNIAYSYDKYQNSTDRMVESDIIDTYISRYNELYSLGVPVNPLQVNDLSFFPSLSELKTQFSIDGGVNYLPINEILDSKYFEKFVIAKDRIVI